MAAFAAAQAAGGKAGRLGSGRLVQRPQAPTPGFEPIAGAVAVMAALVDRCTVNGEQVARNPAASMAAG
jgi:hypothetical protein